MPANLPAEEEADTKPTEELKTESHCKFRVFITNQLQWDAQEILSKYSFDGRSKPAFGMKVKILGSTNANSAYMPIKNCFWG